VIEHLPRFQRRILAVTLLLLVAVAVVRLLAVPLWATYRSNHDAILQMEDSIERYSRLSAQIDALRSTVGELQQTDDLDRYVLAQESEPLAAAALQERVKSVVTRSGGTLSSTQVLPTITEQGFKRVIVNIRMAVSIDALQRVLYELENDLPYLLADDVVILSRGARKRRKPTQGVDQLDVRFNLSGFMRDSQEPT
jgi:hypothetical protein